MPRQRTVSRRALLSGLGGAVAVTALSAAGCGQALLPTPTAAPKPTAPATTAAPAQPNPAPTAAAATPTAQPKAGTKAATIRINARADIVQDFLDEFGKEYEQAHPGITIVQEGIPSAEYFVKLRALSASKQIGDIVWGFISGGAWLAFAPLGVLRPLDDLVKAEGADFLKQWYAPAIEIGKLDGKLYGLPEMSHPGNVVFMVNEDTFAEAGVSLPTTEWDFEKDLVPAAQKLTKRSGDRVDRFGTYVENAYLGLVPMLRRWGGELLNPDGTKCLLDSPENAKAVQFMVDLVTKHKVVPGQQQIEESSTKMVLAGKLASIANTTAGTLATNRAAASGKMKLSGRLTPKGPAGFGSMLAAQQMGVYTGSQVVEPAWDLIKFYTSHDVGVRKVVKASPGGRPDVYHDPRLYKIDPIYELLVPVMDKLQPHILPNNLRGAEMTKVLDNEMQSIWLGKVDVATGLKNAQAEVQKVLDQPR